jgi:hypothetical protein
MNSQAPTFLTDLLSTPSTLKTEAADSTHKTLFHVYQTAQRHVPEYRNLKTAVKPSNLITKLEAQHELPECDNEAKEMFY